MCFQGFVGYDLYQLPISFDCSRIQESIMDVHDVTALPLCSQCWFSCIDCDVLGGTWYRCLPLPGPYNKKTTPCQFHVFILLGLKDDTDL